MIGAMWWLPIGDYPAQVIVLSKTVTQNHWLCPHTMSCMFHNSQGTKVSMITSFQLFVIKYIQVLSPKLS